PTFGLNISSNRSLGRRVGSSLNVTSARRSTISSLTAPSSPRYRINRGKLTGSSIESDLLVTVMTTNAQVGAADLRFLVRLLITPQLTRTMTHLMQHDDVACTAHQARRADHLRGVEHLPAQPAAPGARQVAVADAASPQASAMKTAAARRADV